jgi:glycosyltransferase involved in cell wall biosynthesis
MVCMSDTLPLLSLVYTGRNDSYMGNFNWRLSTTLNYLAHNLQANNRLDQVEAVITDWGSTTPLHTALDLSSAARRITRFVMVPPDVAGRVGGDSEFPLVLAQNAAVRRSHGRYIAQTDSDIMFTPELISGLLDILDGRRSIGVSLRDAMLFTKRRHIPWRYVAQSPSLAELDWFMRHYGRWIPTDTYVRFDYAGPGFMLMSRQLWEACRGYDERLLYRAWIEIDLGIRISREHPLVNLERLGLTAYHLEHFPARTSQYHTRKYNDPIWHNAFCPNGDNWGLGNYEFEIYAYPPEPLPPLATALPGPQPVKMTPQLRRIIWSVIWHRFWYPILFVAGRIVLFTRRAFYHLNVIRQRIANQPLTRWPAQIRGWWIERQQRF